MTYPVWPEYLGKPVAAGFSEGRIDTRRARAAGLPPPAYDRRQGGEYRTQNLQLRAEPEIAHAFWAFWRDDCAQGALRFRMPDPLVDGVSVLDDDFSQWQDEDSAEIIVWDALRLMAWGREHPQTSRVSRIHFIDFSVVILP